MATEDKILVSLEGAANLSRELRSQGRFVALTSGCFDVVHSAHVRYLEMAADCADVLFVGINSDEDVRRLKGRGRPLRAEDDRAFVIAGMTVVDFALVFQDDVELIEAIHPDIYVSSTTSNVVIADDPRRIAALEAIEARTVVIGKFSPLSSTALLQQVAT